MLEGFYELKDFVLEDGDLKGTTVLNQDHDVFKGHFPGQPVVPGVCLLFLLKELVNKTDNGQRLLSEAVQIKFLQAVDPSKAQEINWSISLSDEDDSRTVRAEARWQDKVCLKFSGKFK